MIYQTIFVFHWRTTKQEREGGGGEKKRERERQLKELHSSFHRTHFILLHLYPTRIESFSYWFTSHEPAPILLSWNCFQPSFSVSLSVPPAYPISPSLSLSLVIVSLSQDHTVSFSPPFRKILEASTTAEPT